MIGSFNAKQSHLDKPHVYMNHIILIEVKYLIKACILHNILQQYNQSTIIFMKKKL